MVNLQPMHPRKIAVIGNYVPRQCGIATFTADLCEALAESNAQPDVFTVAMNDRPDGYAYPDRVRYEVDVDDLDGYRQAAEFINISEVDAVSVQHEYRIFGGCEGSHLKELLKSLRVPVVATLHTVLQDPTEDQRRSMDMLVRHCDRFVVMSERGVGMLQDVFGIAEDRIDMIYHGIPDVPFVDPNFYRDQYDLEGRRVLLTFGLLSPTKGLENVIEAMPRIIEHHPDVVYIILGRTHPNERRLHDESYREQLKARVRELGIDQHVRFVNQFVDREELIRYLILADIYVTPYLAREQITSGTLAYSFGAGKAVVSTPYWHAEELLADGRGCLVPFADPGAIADQVNMLLGDSRMLHAIRKQAYLHARDMTWAKVANAYLDSFATAASNRERRIRPTTRKLPSIPAAIPAASERPKLRLDHLRRLTNGIGLLQHAEFGVPRYEEGYDTSDNAKAVQLMSLLHQDMLHLAQCASRLLPMYLAFVRHAFDHRTGRFRASMTFDRHWVDSAGHEECHGRCLLALGTLARYTRDQDHRDLALRLIERALPEARGASSPRAIALALIGLADYSTVFSGDSLARSAAQRLNRRLLEQFGDVSGEDWPWFERVLTYENARLPHALIAAGHVRGDDESVERGLQALRWLMEQQRDPEAGHFVPVGTEGFYRRGGERSRFNQMPVEAESAVSACLCAWEVTGSSHWLREAERAFAWFLGRNDLGIAVAEPRTGACADGLNAKGINRNKGAASTLAYLMALAQLRRTSRMRHHSAEVVDGRPASRRASPQSRDEVIPSRLPAPPPALEQDRRHRDRRLSVKWSSEHDKP